ncbi:MAG: carboxypeptidase [Catalinimonas sp.]
MHKYALALLTVSLFFCLRPLVGQPRKVPPDTTVTTQHQVTIGGSRVAYTAITGTQPVWNDTSGIIATLHYTYYRRNDVADVSRRPLLISFNGGPGSASVWMHVAYTGPRVLKIDDEGYPVQPYGYRENPYSVLDMADIVYVNPVNTGYSRTIPEGGKVDREQFFGINADIDYLAEWLNTFVTRHERWLSPKYLIGESYGGTRVAGLAGALQSQQWMYLNGVIMVSPADYKLYESDTPLSSALNLPYYTAAAWHHKMLPDDLQRRDLTDLLPEVEAYTIDELLPALARGGAIDSTARQRVAGQMARYSGLSTRAVLHNNLDVPTRFFWKELLRDRDGMTIGRLDSRYLGMDRNDAGSSPDYNAELTSWLHAFTPAINHYMREELNFYTDVKYNVFGPVYPWDQSNNNTREQLRQAMSQNPYLHVMVQSGYYDGATTYFGAKYTTWQIDPSGKMRDRIRFHGYRSGHMMYLRREDLKQANDDIRRFILDTTPGARPARY